MGILPLCGNKALRDDFNIVCVLKEQNEKLGIDLIVKEKFLTKMKERGKQMKKMF